MCHSIRSESDRIGLVHDVCWGASYLSICLSIPLSLAYSPSLSPAPCRSRSVAFAAAIAVTVAVAVAVSCTPARLKMPVEAGLEAGLGSLIHAR